MTDLVKTEEIKAALNKVAPGVKTTPPVAPAAPAAKVEITKVDATNIETKPKGPVVSEDSWLYHKDHEPKLFKKGEEVPEGWGSKNSFGWYKDITNNFHWRKK